MNICGHEIEVRDWTLHPNLPVIYIWEIFDGAGPLLRYVGKSKRGHHRPTVAYKEKLEGKRKGARRAVHHALAMAIEKKKKIRLTLFCNVAEDHLQQMERFLIDALFTGAKDGGLNTT
jgi:hypothetical protein